MVTKSCYWCFAKKIAELDIWTHDTKTPSKCHRNVSPYDTGRDI